MVKSTYSWRGHTRQGFGDPIMDAIFQTVINWPVNAPNHIDGFHSILLLWQLEGKGSCDVYIDQSAGSMVM